MSNNHRRSEQPADPKQLSIEQILLELFEAGFDTGGDIVLERQFEDDRPAYERYRMRHIQQALSALESLQRETVDYVIGEDEPETYRGVHVVSLPDVEAIDRNKLRAEQRKRRDERLQPIPPLAWPHHHGKSEFKRMTNPTQESEEAK